MTGYIFEFQGKQFDPDGKVDTTKDGLTPDEHNKAVARAEVEWFMNEKPARHFAYVKTNQGRCECPKSTTFVQSHSAYRGSGICPALRDEPLRITTFTGEVLGDVVWSGRPYRVPAYGTMSTRQNLRIKAINGLVYSAVYYRSSGDYCRMKVMSSSRKRGEK